MSEDKYKLYADNKNICNCPIDEIQYLITSENNKAVFIKTGNCLRCHGIRLNNYGKILQSKSLLKKSKKDLRSGKDEKLL